MIIFIVTTLGLMVGVYYYRSHKPISYTTQTSKEEETYPKKDQEKSKPVTSDDLEKELEDSDKDSDKDTDKDDTTYKV